MTAPGPSKHFSIALGVLAVAIWVVSVLPFSRSFGYGIANCDDYEYVARNTLITNGLSVAALPKTFSLEVAAKQGIWMPLTWISYMVDVEIAGWLGLPPANAVEMGPSAANVMHAHSVFLHGCAAVLLFMLLTILGGVGHHSPPKNSPPSTHVMLIAALGALFWAIHPLRCESAVWISSRKDILSGVFMLMALVLWVKGALAMSLKYSLIQRGVAMMMFLVAATAKPSVMTFPILAVVLDVFILGRIRPGDYILPFLIAMGLGLFAGGMQEAGGATADLAGVPMWARLLNAAAAFGIYLKNTVWPVDLSVQCMHRYPELPRFVWPGLVLSVAAAAWMGAGLLKMWDNRRYFFNRIDYVGLPEYETVNGRRPVFAGCLWFAVAVAPMLGIANFGYHAFADRFTYIPAMGLSIVLFMWMTR